MAPECERAPTPRGMAATHIPPIDTGTVTVPFQ